MTRAETYIVWLTFAFTVFAIAACAEEAATIMQSSKVVADNQPIRVTIATVNPWLDGPTRSYRVGEQIPVAIKLTNLTNAPVKSCLSGDIYQDLPRLTRNGKIVPYTNWQNYVLQTAEREHTCQKDDIPNNALLFPNDPKIVDLLVVTDDRSDPTGALAWYDRLEPGHYELSVRRRFDCCDGAMAQSNTVDFDVAA
jgi:hypothetical protein